MKIIECPQCATKNRINIHSDGMRPICGRCGAHLLKENRESVSIKSTPQKNKFIPFFLIVIMASIIFGVVITPKLMRKDFSNVIAEEAEKTALLKNRFENELLAKKNLLEKQLAEINVQDLRLKATQKYKKILESRKSFDSRFALSPREKVQLQMKNLSRDSTKSFHDVIRSVALKASPNGSDISVHESSKGITLNIDFDMHSMTSGERDTRTKHHTKDALKKEVVHLISRVTNDILQFCDDLDLGFIYVGCRHGVNTKYPDGLTKKENIILYKIRIKKKAVKKIQSNPYLDIYSTTKSFEIEEDNFDDIKIITSRI